MKKISKIIIPLIMGGFFFAGLFCCCTADLLPQPSHKHMAADHSCCDSSSTQKSQHHDHCQCLKDILYSQPNKSYNFNPDALSALKHFAPAHILLASTAPLKTSLLLSGLAGPTYQHSSFFPLYFKNPVLRI